MHNHRSVFLQALILGYVTYSKLQRQIKVKGFKRDHTVSSVGTRTNCGTFKLMLRAV